MQGLKNKAILLYTITITPTEALKNGHHILNFFLTIEFFQNQLILFNNTDILILLTELG